MIDRQLGQFLRRRREAISPAEVGLPEGTRRRTPGLRRAELATLAGISVDYLVRLEQGRDRNPSAQVLAALADALRLDEDDRTYLRNMSACATGGELCPSLVPPARSVRPTVEALLAHLEPAPAVVVNRLADVLAWTSGYEDLVAPIGMLDGQPPNLIRHTFTDPRARNAFPDWEAVAEEHVGNLRAATRASDAAAARLAADLADAAGPSFTDRWAARPIRARRTGLVRLIHPRWGELRLEWETLHLSDAEEQSLLVYLPADAATAAALDRQDEGQGRALRAVRAG